MASTREQLNYLESVLVREKFYKQPQEDVATCAVRVLRRQRELIREFSRIIDGAEEMFPRRYWPQGLDKEGAPVVDVTLELLKERSSEVMGRALAIADVAALASIDANGLMNFDNDLAPVEEQWWNLDLGAKELSPSVRREARYLELRGLLERHPKFAELVRLKQKTGE